MFEIGQLLRSSIDGPLVVMNSNKDDGSCAPTLTEDAPEFFGRRDWRPAGSLTLGSSSSCLPVLMDENGMPLFDLETARDISGDRPKLG
jgi:hypothetical protein